MNDLAYLGRDGLRAVPKFKTDGHVLLLEVGLSRPFN